MRASLHHVRNWVFDLDNTLYPAACDLFALIDARITGYIQRLLNCDAVEAHRVQKAYFHAHGATLAGLMADHGTDPHEYLADVHDVDMAALVHDERLVAGIAALPGRKLIFTNGDAPYATRVLDRLGLADSFEAIHDIHATHYRPKPNELGYEGLCVAYDINPAETLFVEDMARNLKPAKALGMTTVWIDNGSEQGPDVGTDFIDYRITDLSQWLHDILEES